MLATGGTALAAGAATPGWLASRSGSSMGRPHHITPTSVATMTLANPAAIGGRASHDHHDHQEAHADPRAPRRAPASAAAAAARDAGAATLAA